MKRVAATFALIGLTSCTALADIASTEAVLRNGGSEQNPILGSNPTIPEMIGLKIIGHTFANAFGLERELHSLEVGATCNNIFILAGAPNPAGIAAGIICAIGYYNR
jgi:hypothetical protein